MQFVINALCTSNVASHGIKSGTESRSEETAVVTQHCVWMHWHSVPLYTKLMEVKFDSGVKFDPAYVF